MKSDIHHEVQSDELKTKNKLSEWNYAISLLWSRTLKISLQPLNAKVWKKETAKIANQSKLLFERVSRDRDN